MGSQFEDAGAMNPSDCSFLFFLSKILYLFLIMNIMSMGGGVVCTGVHFCQRPEEDIKSSGVTGDCEAVVGPENPSRVPCKSGTHS